MFVSSLEPANTSNFSGTVEPFFTVFHTADEVAGVMSTG